MASKEHFFADYPDAVIYDAPAPHKRKAKNHLIWGDYISARQMTAREIGRFGPNIGDWLAVRSRGTSGFMRRRDVQTSRLLEVNFVDVGQGDGCFVVTPDDKRFVIDAGEGDNMYRFLRWRFNLRRPRNMTHRWSPLQFDFALITHPDLDHYLGFQHLFESHSEDRRDFSFDAVYHNGIVERASNRVTESLGPRSAEDDHGQRYLLDIVETLDDARRVLDDLDLRGRKRYPNLLRDALQDGFTADLRALAAKDGFVPGFEADQDLSLQILGPVTELDQDGASRLRWLGDAGKTKNGHSVILKLKYKDVSLLLGGDLNIPAEEFLLAHYTGLDPHPETDAERRALLDAARPTFEVDLAKACHHGSADFTDLFLEAINSSAVVVSSGDEESHSHPRPDALGALGKYCRGRRPLLFSTELARSPSSKLKDPVEFRREIERLTSELREATDDEQRQKLEKQLNDTYGRLERSVAVYGMITIRTDGKRMLIAQKLEKARSKSQKWDLYRLEPDDRGELHYISKH